jgi:uncharacterized membrane protein
MYNKYSSRTTLGIDERWERVLCYVGIWVSGLIMLLLEHRNQNVRHHAKQSVVVFGILSVIAFVLSFFGAALGWIPLLGFFFTVGFGFFHGVVITVMVLLWLFFVLSALLSPRTHFVGPRSDRMF